MRTVTVKGTEVNILDTKPPVFEQCEAQFGINWDNTTFAYYPDIHTKSPLFLTDDVIQHEYIHLQRQKVIGTEIWWEKYLADKEFRLEEELLAYRRQYNFLKGKMDRNGLYRLVWGWSYTLASPFYGDLIEAKMAYNKIKG